MISTESMSSSSKKVIRIFTMLMHVIHDIFWSRIIADYFLDRTVVVLMLVLGVRALY